MRGIAGKSFFGLPRGDRGLDCALLAAGIEYSKAVHDIPFVGYEQYRKLTIEVFHSRPVTDAVYLALRFSADGVNFDQGASDYGVIQEVRDDANNTAPGGTRTTSIPLTPTSGSIGNLTAEGVSGTINVRLPFDPNVWGRCSFDMQFYSSAATPALTQVTGTGGRRAAQKAIAARLLYNSGDIAVLNWGLYGWK